MIRRRNPVREATEKPFLPSPGMVRFLSLVEHIHDAVEERRGDEYVDDISDLYPTAYVRLEEMAAQAEGWYIGRGKDRSVYAVGGYAVKVARHVIGCDANLAESDRWDRAPRSHLRWLLPTIASDQHGRWLVMHLADAYPASKSWLMRFGKWYSNGKPDIASMPPRSLIDSVEHGDNATDWAVLAGHPVLYDYA